MRHPIVQQRVHAKKQLNLIENDDPKKLPEQLASLALKHKDSGRPVLVFVRKVEDVLKIQESLEKQKQNVITLTGTMRGKERDALAAENKIFARFLPEPPADATPGTVYLVCTSAGEVGVNISADHLVCDLSTFESVAQRFGRVNRFGQSLDTQIDLVYPQKFDPEKPYDVCLARTLDVLRLLEGNASPHALGKLPMEARAVAFAPPPDLLPVTEFLFDAWALTTIKGKLPGRPMVEPYLHGITDWEPPQTQFAWRQEVDEITTRELLEEYPPTELLLSYPLKHYELLTEPSYRAFKHLESLAKRNPESLAWLVDDDGEVTTLTLKDLADSDDKEQINGKTILLPPSVGGLTEQGLLNGTTATPATDVADNDDRVRLWADLNELTNEQEASIQKLHRCQTIAFQSAESEVLEAEASRVWHWFVRRNEGDKTSTVPVTWRSHVDDVEREAEKILTNLKLDAKLEAAIKLAAKYHDHGKLRKQFQRVLGNMNYPETQLAKSGKKSRTRVEEIYRHEFGSLLDVQNETDFQALDDDQRELVLHLIASHHGRARPHFPAKEVFDPERPHDAVEAMGASIAQRFGRLQRRYGRWGLAYLESLLRAADWSASANPSTQKTEVQS